MLRTGCLLRYHRVPETGVGVYVSRLREDVVCLRGGEQEDLWLDDDVLHLVGKMDGTYVKGVGKGGMT